MRFPELLPSSAEIVSIMKNVLVVIGTRPEAIKMAPVVLRLRQSPAEFTVRVCATAQHRDMLDQVLKLFEIIPDYDLDLMRPNQNLFDVSTDSLRELGHIIKQEQPDIVLVQGDTTTALTASQAAFYRKIAVGHIEAGLRSGDKYNPFPEEVNRKLITTLADYHFAPTERNRENLLKENVPPDRIRVTGNTVIDALYCVLSHHRVRDCWLGKKIDWSKRIILVTVHRRESFGLHLENICQAIAEIARSYSTAEIVYPVHRNPNVKDTVHHHLRGITNVRLLPPLDYATFVFLMSKSYIVLTDSGGIQEEAPALGKPVLVLREKTERTEAIEAGTVRLIGRDKNNIVRETSRLLDDENAFEQMAGAVNPYGDGNAAVRICEHLVETDI